MTDELLEIREKLDCHIAFFCGYENAVDHNGQAFSGELSHVSEVEEALRDCMAKLDRLIAAREAAGDKRG